MAVWKDTLPSERVARVTVGLLFRAWHHGGKNWDALNTAEESGHTVAASPGWGMRLRLSADGLQ